MHKNSKTEIISRDLIEHINKEREKSDRSTIARLDSIVKANKQNYKSNLMIEKYSLLSSQSYPFIPVQTALKQLSEKHPDFEIQLLTPFNPQGLNIHKLPRHWYQLILPYQLSESIYNDSQT